MNANTRGSTIYNILYRKQYKSYLIGQNHNFYNNIWSKMSVFECLLIRPYLHECLDFHEIIIFDFAWLTFLAVWTREMHIIPTCKNGQHRNQHKQPNTMMRKPNLCNTCNYGMCCCSIHGNARRPYLQDFTTSISTQITRT